jgi:Glyoxalase/Bleomycin resistance protein/Dioxygenase superfamily
MDRGSTSHIALTVSDVGRSTDFYDKVFQFIDFKRVEVSESTQQAMKTPLKAWVGPGYSINIARRRVSLPTDGTIETLLDLTILP